MAVEEPTMKMFEDGQDPWSRIQELEALVHHHHRQIKTLEHNVSELARLFTAQSRLVEQIAQQNTELLKDQAILKQFRS